jgi:hypothetical protein
MAHFNGMGFWFWSVATSLLGSTSADKLLSRAHSTPKQHRVRSLCHHEAAYILMCLSIQWRITGEKLYIVLVHSLTCLCINSIINSVSDKWCLGLFLVVCPAMLASLLFVFGAVSAAIIPMQTSHSICLLEVSLGSVQDWPSKFWPWSFTIFSFCHFS